MKFSRFPFTYLLVHHVSLLAVNTVSSIGKIYFISATRKLVFTERYTPPPQKKTKTKKQTPAAAATVSATMLTNDIQSPVYVAE